MSTSEIAQLRQRIDIEVMNMGMIYPPSRKDAEPWLKSIGCKVSKEGDFMSITLPDGCREEEVSDSRFQQASIITLPTGVKIMKCISLPCLNPACNHVKVFAVIEEKK
jgi:hypothetical protein